MAAKPTPPDLKKYMEKRLSLKLNANRNVTGILRGFDHFMNLVLDDAVEDVSPTEKTRLGMIVSVLVRGAVHRVGALDAHLFTRVPHTTSTPLR